MQYGYILCLHTQNTLYIILQIIQNIVNKFSFNRRINL